ncbi:Uncharacterized protein GBIM_03893, partial [Gryllus bimaculatus]
NRASCVGLCVRGSVLKRACMRAAAEAAWLREADTALLAGQLAQLLRAQGAGAPPGAASDGGPADWAPLLIFDGDAADNDPYLLAAQDGAVGKRSRYYRRYPWKRQPGRGGGASPAVDYDNPYLCNPTREDVFQLLVALHEARAGNLGRTVSFCNRRRPAASVFTNIRFLGRRRRR